jgi:hypothetical protein
MNATLDDNLIAQARAVFLLAVTERHGVNLAKQGRREFVGPCPHCGGCSRFTVNPDKAVFFCRGCRASGCGAIDLEIFLSGRDFVAAIEALTGAALPSAEQARAAAAQRYKRARSVQAEQIHTARWLWEQRRAPQGTIVERYLAARGFTGQIPATVGYLPPRGGYPPAMIAAYAPPIELDDSLCSPRYDDVAAVHITRLKADGSDRLRDADAKRTVGAPLGFPIALAPITDGLSLAITEGIEDGLAYCAAGFAVWAYGSASYLGAEFAAALPAYLETLIIERHPDEASYIAVAELRQRLKGRCLLDIHIREAVS